MHFLLKYFKLQPLITYQNNALNLLYRIDWVCHPSNLGVTLGSIKFGNFWRVELLIRTPHYSVLEKNPMISTFKSFKMNFLLKYLSYNHQLLTK